MESNATVQNCLAEVKRLCEVLSSHLTSQQSQIMRAFDSLTAQLRTTHSLSDADKMLTSVNTTIERINVLLSFLFDRVFLHVVDSSLDFVQQLELLYSDPESRHCLSQSIANVRNAPSNLQQVQKKYLTSLYLSRKKVKRNARSVEYRLGISSAYDDTIISQLTQTITRKLRITAIVLPPSSRESRPDEEEAAALQLQCTAVITPLQYPMKVKYFTAEVFQEKLHDFSDSKAVDLSALLHALAILEEPTASSSLYDSSRSVEEGGEESVSGTQESTVSTLGRDSFQRPSKRRRTVTSLSEALRSGRVTQSVEEGWDWGTPNSPTAGRRSQETAVEETGEFLLSQGETQSQQVAYYRVEATDHWSDQREKELLSQKPPSEWRFLISNSVREQKQDIIHAIQTLGSTVDTGAHYNPNATHLVAAEGITERTEKYLGSCAAGLFIVSPAYVLESLRRGRWMIGVMDEYNMNPRRRYGSPMRPDIFASWKVLLLSCHTAVATGLQTVLHAGGCTSVEVCVLSPDDVAELPASGSEAKAIDRLRPSEGQIMEGIRSDCVFEDDYIASRTHILVECQVVSLQGVFQLPPWFPTSLMKQSLYPRLFTLEILSHVLCLSKEDPFDADGKLRDSQLISSACRMEPFQ